MIYIRQTTADDRNNIDALLGQSLPALMINTYTPDILAVAIPMISKSRPELLSSGTYFVATTENKEIIGCGGWTKYSPNPDDKNNEKSNTGHIRHFATHPDFTRQGIGRKIYDQCKYQAQQQNITNFECFASLNAENFYKSLGFKTIEQTTVPLTLETQFPCLLMHQTL